jgi:hypothetical protein
MILQTPTHAKSHKYDAPDMLWWVAYAVTPRVLHPPPSQWRQRTSERRIYLARGSPGSGDADPGGADPTREQRIQHGAVDPASGPSGGRSGEQRSDPASGWPPPASGRGDGADPVSRAVAPWMGLAGPWVGSLGLSTGFLFFCFLFV